MALALSAAGGAARDRATADGSPRRWSARRICLSRFRTSWRPPRSRTRRATTCHLLTGASPCSIFAEAILFVPFAVVAVRVTLGQIEPALEDSARSLGTSTAGTLLAGDAAAGAPGAGRRRRPGIRVRARRPVNHAGAASSGPVHARDRIRGYGATRHVRRGRAVCRLSVALSMVATYVAHEPLRPCSSPGGALTMAELRCEGLAKSFGARSVLSDVDLVVAEGTLTAILGASGSGKTTLLRADHGTSSRSTRDDLGWRQRGGRGGRAVHVAPGQARDRLRGAGRRAIPAPDRRGERRLRPAPRRSARRGRRVAEMLELVGLADGYADRRPHELSGGEQRRVALARALAPRPRLVLLDEPFSGLDAMLRVETREAVLRALAGEGTTALLVTHDQAEALSMGREVAVLRNGKLVQRAAPVTLYRQPTDPEVALLRRRGRRAAGYLRRWPGRCALGELDVADVQRRRAGPGHGPPRADSHGPARRRYRRGGGQAVPAHVLDSTYYGPQTVVRLALDAPGRRSCGPGPLTRMCPRPATR